MTRGRHLHFVFALALGGTAAAHAAPETVPAALVPVALEAQVGRPAPGTGLARRPDERRPDKGVVVEMFGQAVRLSGEYEATYDTRLNLDLNQDRANDRAKLEQELKFEATLSPRPDVTVFLKLKGDSEIDTWRESGAKKRSNALERDQTWIFFAGVGGLPLDLQLGRIGLIEPRSWWWDRDLDAVRVFLGNSTWLVETGLAREMAPVATDDDGIDPKVEDLVRWFGHAAWAWRKDHHLEVYWLLARDRSGRPEVGGLVDENRADPVDDRLNWFGIRVAGEEATAGGHRLGYWLDATRLTGRSWRTGFDDAGDSLVVVTDQHLKRIDAGALDVGVLWSLPGQHRPTAWLGWAAGSGDGNAANDSDRTFRQTGLQENKGRFGGVKRFHYYGELFRPELSNLGVASLGFGTRFLDNSSVDLVLHDYRQRRASTRLPVGRLVGVPTGVDPRLGREVDLFFAFRESKRVELTASFAAFRAGRSFGAREGELARFVEFGLTWNF